MTIKSITQSVSMPAVLGLLPGTITIIGGSGP